MTWCENSQQKGCSLGKHWIPSAVADSRKAVSNPNCSHQYLSGSSVSAEGPLRPNSAATCLSLSQAKAVTLVLSSVLRAGDGTEEQQHQQSLLVPPARSDTPCSSWKCEPDRHLSCTITPCTLGKARKPQHPRLALKKARSCLEKARRRYQADTHRVGLPQTLWRAASIPTYRKYRDFSPANVAGMIVAILLLSSILEGKEEK